jgi:hypothetical protein
MGCVMVYVTPYAKVFCDGMFIGVPVTMYDNVVGDDVCIGVSVSLLSTAAGGLHSCARHSKGHTESVSEHCDTYQFYATGRSPVQRSPTDCGISEFNRGTSQKRPIFTRAVEP